MSAKHRILILQHPRETKEPLSTAKLVCNTVTAATIRIGLSWKSLSSALGEELNPRQWAVLFLGTRQSARTGQDLCGLPPRQKNSHVDFQILSPKGAQVDVTSILGIVVLDGSWKDAKALWWRNPWLLRLNRVILRCSTASKYQILRRAPRRDCLSTIEAIAETLGKLGNPELKLVLNKALDEFVTRNVKARDDAEKVMPEQAQHPHDAGHSHDIWHS